MPKEIKDKRKDKFLEEVQRELGYVSGLFMSQECKGTEIIMPTEELKEVSDRIGLYLFEALAQEKQKCEKEKEHKHNFQFIQKEIWENGLGQTDGKIYALFICECGEKKRNEV